MTDLATLLERVRKASGANYALEVEIHRAFTTDDVHAAMVPPPYTASIDAAVALFERAKPGWFWRGGHVPIPHWDGQQYRDCWAHLSRTDASNCIRGDEATGWHDTVPLSIIAALLQAKIAESAPLSALDTGSGR